MTYKGLKHPTVLNQWISNQHMVSGGVLLKFDNNQSGFPLLHLIGIHYHPLVNSHFYCISFLAD